MVCELSPVCWWVYHAYFLWQVCISTSFLWWKCLYPYQPIMLCLLACIYNVNYLHICSLACWTPVPRFSPRSLSLYSYGHYWCLGRNWLTVTQSSGRRLASRERTLLLISGAWVSWGSAAWCEQIVWLRLFLLFFSFFGIGNWAVMAKPVLLLPEGKVICPFSWSTCVFKDVIRLCHSYWNLYIPSTV